MILAGITCSKQRRITSRSRLPANRCFGCKECLHGSKGTQGKYLEGTALLVVPKWPHQAQETFVFKITPGLGKCSKKVSYTFTPVLNLDMRFAYGHCWRQDAGPDGCSEALISAIDKVLPRYFSSWYPRCWWFSGFFLTWSVFQVPGSVWTSIRIILLMVPGELRQWISVWLEQDFWNKNSEGFSLFSTLQVLLWKWLHLLSFPPIISVAVSSQICCKNCGLTALGIICTLLCYSSPKNIS